MIINVEGETFFFFFLKKCVVAGSVAVAVVFNLVFLTTINRES